MTKGIFGEFKEGVTADHLSNENNETFQHNIPPHTSNEKPELSDEWNKFISEYGDLPQVKVLITAMYDYVSERKRIDKIKEEECGSLLSKIQIITEQQECVLSHAIEILDGMDSLSSYPYFISFPCLKIYEPPANSNGLQSVIEMLSSINEVIDDFIKENDWILKTWNNEYAEIEKMRKQIRKEKENMEIRNTK